jgi:dihydrofolate reductase
VSATPALTPRLTLVVARADNGVIGRDGGLPWHLPADLKHFKALTLGKPVVMGRRTFVAIGRPLPGRHNIVLTRGDWTAAGVTVVPDLAAALAAAGDVPEAMIIGGAGVYAAALPRAHRVHLTEVHAAPAGDTRLPPFDPALWAETARDDHAGDGDAPGYSFVTLERC